MLNLTREFVSACEKVMTDREFRLWRNSLARHPEMDVFSCVRAIQMYLPHVYYEVIQTYHLYVTPEGVVYGDWIITLEPVSTSPVLGDDDDGGPILE